MRVALKHIAFIQTGVFARPVKEGQIVYLQSKHFDENGILKSFLYPDLKSDSISEKHLLQNGDIIFAAKGTKNFAALYESKNKPAVASTSFFVIRLNEDFQDKVLPEYLTWYLNSASSQNYLKSQAVGSSIVSISKSVIDELELSIPDLDTQKAILRITHLRNAERKLLQQIEILREKQIQQEIINAIK
ncbi:MAG: restriction endonuclease subunit S [Bacteroidales bacterium]